MTRQRLASLHDRTNGITHECKSGHGLAAARVRRRIARRMTMWLLAIAAIHGLQFGSAVAQITLHADFEAASLDENSSVVNGTNVTLAGVASWTEHADLLGPVYLRATGVDGVQPTFRVHRPSNPANLNGHPFFYSYDQQNWQPFDQSSNAGAFRQFTNDQPFTQDEVYVSYAVPYPLSRTTERVADWASSPYVTPTNSADQNLVIGTVTNTTSFGPSELPVYGLKITDNSSPLTKKSVVLISGNHSGEMAATWGLEGSMDFLLSDHPDAVQLRERAEIFVYPQVDPLGRVEGYWRGNSQNPAIDHNRAWDAETNPTHSGFTEIGIVHDAITTDTADYSQIELFSDYHAFYSPESNFVYASLVNEFDPFLTTLQTLEPDLNLEFFDDLPPEVLNSSSVFQFDQAQGYAPEFRPDSSVLDYLGVGESYGIALHAAIVTNPGDYNADGSLDCLDIDPLVAEIAAGTNQSAYDLTEDGLIDLADRDAWLAEAGAANLESGNPFLLGDANLDGTVDFLDLNVWSENRFQSGAGWCGADFDASGFVDFLDLNIWSEFRFQSSDTAAMVPEPNSLLVCLLGLPMLVRRIRA